MVVEANRRGLRCSTGRSTADLVELGSSAIRLANGRVGFAGRVSRTVIAGPIVGPQPARPPNL